MNKNKIFLGIVMAAALLFAIVVGQTVAENNFSRLGMYAGVAVLAIGALGLKQNAWLLIPVFSGFSGTIGGGRLPASIAEMSVVFCFGLFVLFKALKVIPEFPRLRICDKLLICNLLYLATVFARNPVGVDFIRSNLIGGRPYFAILLACCGFWVLQHVTIKPKLAKLLPVLMCFGSVVNALSGLVGYFAPSLGYRLATLYSGFMPGGEANPLDMPNDNRVERHQYLAGFGVEVGRAVVSYASIFKLIFFQNFLLSVCFFASLVAILLSGFRSNLIGWFFAIALATYIRGGVRHIVPLVAVGLAGVVMVVVLQTAGFSVPLAAQRALSFIPISWDSRASLDAKGSVDWRVDMWRLALTSDRYIKNKVLGDGFGFDPAELRAQTTLTSLRMDTSYGLQDYFMITGDYHSGPVSAIRFVGYIGLVLFTTLLVAKARYAWKIINMAKNTAYFPVALFFGIAAIFHPICFWLIFGGYGGDFVQAIFTLGMLNLIHRSIQKEHASANSSPAPLWVGAL
jgi:hypothetical protein